MNTNTVLRFTFLALILSVIFLHDTEAQTFFASGQLEYIFEKSDADNAEATTSFTILPGVGVVIGSKGSTTLGIAAGYQSKKVPFEYTSNSLIVSPSARYLKSLNNYLTLSFALSAPMSFGKGETLNNQNEVVPNSETEINTYGGAFSPGLLFFVHKNFALDLQFNALSYTKKSMKTTNPLTGEKEDNKAGSGTTFRFGDNLAYIPSVAIFYVFSLGKKDEKQM